MKKLQLLLLEDLEEEALELSSFLEDNDYEVSLAKNAVEAEKLIRSRYFSKSRQRIFKDSIEKLVR